eukprot:gene14110-biopygen23198
MSKLQYELCAQSILGKLDVVESLLHAGAELFTTVGGCGALCHAAFHGHKKVVLKIVFHWSAFTDLGIYRETNVAEMIELALFLAQKVASALKRLKEAAPDQKLLLAQQCLTALIMTVDNLTDDSNLLMENQFAITAIDALKSPAQAQLTVRLAFLAASLHLAGPPVQYSHWVTAMQLFVDDTNRPTRVDPYYFLPTAYEAMAKLAQNVGLDDLINQANTLTADVSPILEAGPWDTCDPQAQRRLISEVLGPLYQANRSSLVLMGDFNFTLDVEMDRFNGAASSNTSHPDQLTSSLIATTCPKLPCAFRHRHPTRRSFTHFWSAGASRLDRAHVSEQLLPYILQCQPASTMTSDHRPLLLHLLRPAVPENVGPGAKRTRMHFAKMGNLREAFSDWLSHASQSARPLGEDEAFIHGT